MLKDLKSYEAVNKILLSYYDEEQLATKTQIIEIFGRVMDKINVVCGVSSNNEINDEEFCDEEISDEEGRELRNKYIDVNLSLSSQISRVIFEAIDEISIACGIPRSIIFESILCHGLEKYGIYEARKF